MTREEAIKTIRLTCPKISDSECDFETAMRFLIPELAESEEERIRKFLLDYAIEMIAGLESDISRSTYDGIKGHDPDAEAELNQWQKARAYLEKHKEQKPNIEICPHSIKSKSYSETGYPIVQKSAEWSEEDENRLNAVVELLENSSAIHPNYSRRKLIIWLKSLRPSWKPSEEQMRILNWAANGMVDKSIAAPEMRAVLRELYNQLKKLM